MVVTLEIAPEIETRLLQEARRKGLDAKSFVINLVRERLGQPSSPTAPELLRSETDLLEEINRGLSADQWKRYRDLIDKRRAETLTSDEHAELIAISDQIEEDNVHRVECLAELARRRNVSLDTLMDDLGIRPTIA